MDLTGRSIDRIIEIAWEYRTTFEAIKLQFNLNEQEVITLMRREMKLVVSKCGELVFKEERQNIKNYADLIKVGLNVHDRNK